MRKWFKSLSLLIIVTLLVALIPVLVKADSDVWSATAESKCQYASSTVYNTAWVAASGSMYSPPQFVIGQNLTGVTYYINRQALIFDTSSIPYYADISAATLYFTGGWGGGAGRGGVWGVGVGERGGGGGGRG